MANHDNDPAHALDRLLAHAGWARRLAASLGGPSKATARIWCRRPGWRRCGGPPESRPAPRPWLKTVLRNLLVQPGRATAAGARRGNARRQRRPRSPRRRKRLRHPVRGSPAAGDRRVGAARGPAYSGAAPVLRVPERGGDRRAAGVPAGTVRARLLAARADLRSRLSEGGDQGAVAAGAVAAGTGGGPFRSPGRRKWRSPAPWWRRWLRFRSFGGGSGQRPAAPSLASSNSRR